MDEVQDKIKGSSINQTLIGNHEGVENRGKAIGHLPLEHSFGF